MTLFTPLYSFKHHYLITQRLESYISNVNHGIHIPVVMYPILRTSPLPYIKVFNKWVLVATNVTSLTWWFKSVNLNNPHTIPLCILTHEQTHSKKHHWLNSQGYGFASFPWYLNPFIVILCKLSYSSQYLFLNRERFLKPLNDCIV